MARKEMLAGMIDRIFEVTNKNVTDEKLANKIAEEIVDVIRDDWGGQAVYIPKDIDHKLLTRNQEIFSKFNGKNTIELALEYGLTEMRIRQILKRRHLYKPK